MMIAMADMDKNGQLQQALGQLEDDLASAMDEKCKDIFIRT